MMGISVPTMNEAGRGNDEFPVDCWVSPPAREAVLLRSPPARGAVLLRVGRWATAPWIQVKFRTSGTTHSIASGKSASLNAQHIIPRLEARILGSISKGSSLNNLVRIWGSISKGSSLVRIWGNISKGSSLNSPVRICNKGVGDGWLLLSRRRPGSKTRGSIPEDLNATTTTTMTTIATMTSGEIGMGNPLHLRRCHNTLELRMCSTRRRPTATLWPFHNSNLSRCNSLPSHLPILPLNRCGRVTRP